MSLGPSVIIPFSRDTDFVERGDLLDRILQKCTEPGSRTALVGLGGVGKSQLAIEAAYRIRERSPETWVFWVYASNASRFEQSFGNIATYIQLPGRQDEDANMLQLIHDWLCYGKRKWVMILDNVDNGQFLFDSRSKNQKVGMDSAEGDNNETLPPLESYLPRSPNGSILVTTRNKNAARTLVEDHNILDIEAMTSNDAVALLQKKLKVQEDGDQIRQLAIALECMPLAIVQAAAYISQRAPRYSARQYLEQFRKSDHKKESLLNREGGQLRRDGEAKNSIIITWQISFEHIRQTRPSAADLLSLMSFFDPQSIPDFLLYGQNEDQNTENKPETSTKSSASYHDCSDHNNENYDEDNISQSSYNEEFEDDIMALRDYSFVSANEDKVSFQMHSLVQLATRKWLSGNSQADRWKGESLRRLDQQFPYGDYEDWPKCKLLFPHVIRIAAERPNGQDLLLRWASVLHKAGRYEWKLGNGAEAEKMLTEAAAVQKTFLGAEDEDTLKSVEVLGLSLILQGKWREAEELFVGQVETRKNRLGEDHADTLTSMSNLALTYANQGRWQVAEELQERVLGVWKKRFGEDHPNTITSIANLAVTYYRQGRLEAAEELELQVLEMRKKKLGEDHPDMLTSISNLAVTYSMQGRWEAAEELQVQALEMKKKKLGEDHPNTLTSMANLLLTYSMQGRWKAAEELEVQVAEMRKKKLGEDHPDTLSTIANLATIHWNHERWKAAEELELQVLERLKMRLGEDHPDTLTVMSNLAVTYWSQGRLETAEELEVQVLEMRKRRLGEDHIDTLSSMNNLAHTWKALGREADAVQLMADCVRLKELKLGVQHPNAIISAEALAEWEID
ncbi:hypothetical protein BX600DRAFT_164630 [Xylariales sp. PMI_506]|nr:hypothetical protein BX600DRAFT_164630 [Xylariales sp. PMI_506]